MKLTSKRLCERLICIATMALAFVGREPRFWIIRRVVMPSAQQLLEDLRGSGRDSSLVESQVQRAGHRDLVI